MLHWNHESPCLPYQLLVSIYNYTLKGQSISIKAIQALVNIIVTFCHMIQQAFSASQKLLLHSFSAKKIFHTRQEHHFAHNGSVCI